LAAFAVIAFAAPAAAKTPGDETAAPEHAAAPAVAEAPAAPAVVTEAPTAPAAVATAPAKPVAAVHPWIRPAEPAADKGDDDDWHGSFAAYGFLSSINGELRARDRVVEIDRSFGDITDVLKFAAGVRVEAQHGPWGFAFDNNYVHIGDDVTTARGLVP